MKSILATLGVLFFAVSISTAQPRKGQHPKELPNAEKVEKMLNHLAKELSLTDEQKSEIKALYLTHFAELRKDHEKREIERLKHEEQRNEFFASVKAELNEEQVEKFDKFNERRLEKRKGRGNDHPRN